MSCENSPFRDGDQIGRLMLLEPDYKTQFKFTIWFDYTRKMLNSIQEGDFIAVPNFAMENPNIKYSILKLTNVLPQHFALGSSPSDLGGYPGFVTESAKNLVVSWREQETESLEDLTKIVCVAVPTGLEFEDVDDLDNIKINQESAMPMIGEECKLISDELTKKIVNGNIDLDEESVIIPGNIIRKEDINAYLRIEELIKTHFGIFGFTGVGKSNLLSSMVHSLLEEDLPKKIVLFDLMDEFTGLLIDDILETSINSTVVCLGEHILPSPTLDYIYDNNNDIEDAANVFLQGMLLPKGLKSKLKNLRPSIVNLLESKKIKVLQEGGSTLGQFYELHKEIGSTLRGDGKSRYNALIEKVIKPHYDDVLNKDLADQIISEIERLEQTPLIEPAKDSVKEKIEYLKFLITDIHEYNEELDTFSDSKIKISEIVSDLNNKDNNSLYIVTSHDPDRLRTFARSLGYQLYENRRRTGKISPLVSFIFDEADQFIPQDAKGSQKDSKKIIEDLTRRGRKFGIGVGIATQRAVYLDTNIMGQLHTYIISKLPRESDRDRVGEAFSLADEEFVQTFKFIKGDWLLVSHDATGLDAVPIPIHSTNAEDRIKKFIENSKSG